MLSGDDVPNVDGSEWYFPDRLTIDTAGVGNGIADGRPAGPRPPLDAGPPTSRPRCGSTRSGRRSAAPMILDAIARARAAVADPVRHLTLVNRQSTYAHNDPTGAYPLNVFFSRLVPFLDKVGRGAAAHRARRAKSERHRRAGRSAHLTRAPRSHTRRPTA